MLIPPHLQSRQAAMNRSVASYGLRGQYLQGQAAKQQSINDANPYLRPAATQDSFSGTFYEPWQRELGQQLGQTYSTALDALVGQLGQQSGGGGAPGALPGGGDFASYFNSIASPTGGGQFTDIPQSQVWSPQALQEATNTIWADSAARAANQSRNLQQSLRPGFGSNSAVQAELLNANQGRNDAIAARDASDLFQRAGVENAQHGLNTAIAQSNVENLRSAHQRQLAQLASGIRGQDIQREVGLQGIAADERSALLRALGGFGGGSGGFLSPLQYSESRSRSGPTEAVFPGFSSSNYSLTPKEKHFYT